MYRILICGTLHQARLLARMTEEILSEFGIQGTISVTDQPRRLLSLKEGEGIGLLLLDADGDGMDTARMLREQHPELDIALYAGDAALAFEGYSVRACGFLRKPVERERLRELIRREYETRFLSTHLRVGERYLRLNRIRYLEIAGKKVIAHMTEGEQCCLNGKLDDIAALLPREFVRCHKSYLVNLRYVEAVQRYQLTMSDGMVLPISKARSREFQLAFLEYIS